MRSRRTLFAQAFHCDPESSPPSGRAPNGTSQRQAIVDDDDGSALHGQVVRVVMSRLPVFHTPKRRNLDRLLKSRNKPFVQWWYKSTLVRLKEPLRV
ncbi:hypothetical protein CCMA1212_010285 [Trichoderma ghanense]|uniref:Uncharacterized protein n=1 Tax=Trichoderma ghanense TaxID=65468 RepID=A0ABY2GQR3_9HYPO